MTPSIAVAKTLFAQAEMLLTVRAPLFEMPHQEGQPVVVINHDRKALTTRVTITCEDPDIRALVAHILETTPVSFTQMMTMDDVYPEELENGTYSAADFPSFSIHTYHLEREADQDETTLVYRQIAISS